MSRQSGSRASASVEQVITIGLRLMTIPGVGPITATAITALVPAAESFRVGRDFAAWLGLTPLQKSTRSEREPTMAGNGISIAYRMRWRAQPDRSQLSEQLTSIKQHHSPSRTPSPPFGKEGSNGKNGVRSAVQPVRRSTGATGENWRRPTVLACPAFNTLVRRHALTGTARAACKSLVSNPANRPAAHL